MGRRKKIDKNNYKFIDSKIMNEASFIDYLERFRKLALSIFEWVNLPSSMDSRYLELSLYEDGQCALLKDKKYGFINTKCTGSGLNIYGLPSVLDCYSYDYQTRRSLYTGLPKIQSEAMLEYMENNEAILVKNNWDRTPTMGSMELFAYRLAEADRSCDVNIKGQKFPIIILVDEKSRVLMENLYNQYNGNQPFIFGDKKSFGENGPSMNAINTGSPFVADKLIDYKKEIWNEALTFLGINNIIVDKKERMITDEANSNNELINLNLQSYLAPRQEACRQFNEKFGFTGTNKEISVRVRSDLHNIIKNVQSIVNDYKEKEIKEDLKEEGVNING